MGLLDKLFKRKKYGIPADEFGDYEDKSVTIPKDEIGEFEDKTPKAPTVSSEEPKPFNLPRFNVPPTQTDNVPKPFKVPDIQSQPAEPVILNGKTETELKRAIEKKGNEIIKKLKLDQPYYESTYIDKNNPFYISPRIHKIFTIFKYLVENSVYDEAIIADKRQFKEKTLSELIVKEIYRCLCEGHSVCSGDAASLVYLLSKVGIDSAHVVIYPPDHDKANSHSVVAFDGIKNGVKQLMIADVTLMRVALNNGTINNLTHFDFCHTKDFYFKEVRKGWYIKTVAKEVQIDSKDSGVNI